MKGRGQGVDGRRGLGVGSRKGTWKGQIQDLGERGATEMKAFVCICVHRLSTSHNILLWLSTLKFDTATWAFLKFDRRH